MDLNRRVKIWMWMFLKRHLELCTIFLPLLTYLSLSLLCCFLLRGPWVFFSAKRKLGKLLVQNFASSWHCPTLLSFISTFSLSFYYSALFLVLLHDIPFCLYNSSISKSNKYIKASDARKPWCPRRPRWSCKHEKWTGYSVLARSATVDKSIVCTLCQSII